ncbi:MAG: septum formation protein Maf [Erysipelotrichia bacterium]|nr:septum formation protein Maf [Erysipelotrichia bacterium]
MEEISSAFKVVVAAVDESLSFIKYHDACEIIKDIALRKCEAVAKDYRDKVVIAADTVVVINKEMIGKPKDHQDAYRILKKLSGKRHDVYTAYAIKHGQKLIQNIVKSTVYFNELSDDLIWFYIATGSPMDKAGAYGFQDDVDFSFIKKVVGSTSNVVGFPVSEIKKDLQKLKVVL